MSDHMQEATNYIKDLQKGIQELSDKRDRLKNSYSTSGSSSSSSSSYCVAPQNPCYSRASDFVIVTSTRAGVEVIINTALIEELPLSRVLKLLIDEGLSTISCTSAQVNDRLLHTIESEVLI